MIQHDFMYFNQQMSINEHVLSLVRKYCSFCLVIVVVNSLHWSLTAGVFSLLVWCLITDPVHGVNFPCEWLILVSSIAMSCQAPWQVWLVSGGSSRMMLIYFAALIRCFRCYRRTFFLVQHKANLERTRNLPSFSLFQIGEEIKGCLDFLRFVYEKFGFSFKLYLSTRPDKYMGKLELWNSAEAVRGTPYDWLQAEKLDTRTRGKSEK